MSSGKYIVLEGPEGVGKTTQIQLLARKLQQAGLPVRILREPDSQSDLTARAIRQLTQDPRYPMNTRTEVLLYNAARSQSLSVIRDSIQQGVICIVDRNYLTTLAIQYYGRGDVPDYQTINTIINFAVAGIEPDLCIVLDAPVDTLVNRAKHRGRGERFDSLGADFLERVRAGYLWEARQRQMPVVSAIETEEDIAATIWRLVSNELASRQPSRALGIQTADERPMESEAPNVAAPEATPVSAAHTASQNNGATVQNEVPSKSRPGQGSGETTADQLLLQKRQDGSYEITQAGHDYLAQTVTDTAGNVYAFTEELSPVTIAAAMARLSRRGDDMRVTLLDEFANQLGKDEQLLRRVITAYGDDSVQQLAGIHVVVEEASNLLTKKLEWGRLAAYLEQSTRYIYYDKKDSKGQYRYHVPEEFDDELTGAYRQHMDRIFELYSSMVHALTDHVRTHSSVPDSERDAAFNGATRAQACDAIRPVLPVATTSTVGIYGSGQALESLVMHLQSESLSESKTTGDKLLKAVRDVSPILFERADRPDRGGAVVAYRATTMQNMTELAKALPHADGALSEPVTLTDVWPRNEMDLIADMLYEHSDLPLEHIRDEVATWPYQKKLEAMTSYFGDRLNRRHKPGRALEKAHYSWDLVCDYGIFRDLQRHRMVDDLQWQILTPKYGYAVPELVAEAGLVEQFDECFAISQKLYDILLESLGASVAQYATLLGHKMRWKVTYNAREAFHLHELRTSPQGHPGYRKLVQQMHEKLEQVHPIIASAMKFVNQGEDEELTRLAAERYTQFKLKQMSATQAIASTDS
ncbi:MAG TPA: dTMP kinase [Candidatus Limnocylindrales bacterium]|nr:dTMP kinase [Candidatus Limnocylindrales bacterium]